MKKTKPILATSILLASISAQAAMHDNHQHQSGPEAPIGIMGAHTHGEGSYMVTYRLMQMDMDGLRSNTSRIDSSSTGFNMNPQQMDMQMHMLSMMYGFTDKVTLMYMLPVNALSMTSEASMNTGMMTMTGQGTTEASGIGDVKLSALYQHNQSTIFNLGLSIPTGSIDETDTTAMGALNNSGDIQLAYPMQLGSGTYDFLPAVTYTSASAGKSWGLQANAVFRLGENDRNYTLGNRYQMNSWYVLSLNQKSSASMRLSYEKWDNIDGADTELNAMMMPTANPDLRAGQQATIFSGVKYSFVKGQDFGIEIGVPVYQKLDGPQLETDLVMNLGWQMIF
jgi:hypothetical protein